MKKKQPKSNKNKSIDEEVRLAITIGEYNWGMSKMGEGQHYGDRW